MTANTMIVDDEKMARSELSYLLENDERFQVKDEAENGKKAISLLRKNDYQLIFLDIKMPGFSGMEIARPLKEERFRETLDRVWKRLSEKENSDEKDNKLEDFLEAYQTNNEDNILCKIPVEEKERYRLIDYSDIYYFSTADKKVKVHTKKESYLTNLKLK